MVASVRRADEERPRLAFPRTVLAPQRHVPSTGSHRSSARSKYLRSPNRIRHRLLSLSQFPKKSRQFPPKSAPVPPESPAPGRLPPSPRPRRLPPSPTPPVGCPPVISPSRCSFERGCEQQPPSSKRMADALTLAAPANDCTDRRVFAAGRWQARHSFGDILFPQRAFVRAVNSSPSPTFPRGRPQEPQRRGADRRTSSSRFRRLPGFAQGRLQCADTEGRRP